ncbi:hypothetical protein [Kocuria rosea]|uniref:hypothetical protein n=1 Tax=Kocuria rosea TaxID=1275 RepID=UPI0030193415
MTTHTTTAGEHMQAKLRAARLREELAAIEAAEAQREQTKADAVRKAQEEQDARVLDRWRQEDERIHEEGEQAQRAAVAAVHAGDLQAAYNGYTAWLASRALRNLVRSNAHNAATRLGINSAPGLHDLRAIDYDFAGFINDNSPARVAALAADEYAARFDGTYPTSWEDLTPEQQAAAGLDDEDPTPDNEDEDHTQP